METPCIYKIISNVNSRIYVGSAWNFEKRKYAHLRLLINGRHHNNKLQNHVNKYGIEVLSFEILENVEKKEDLVNREQHYIDTLNPWFNGKRIVISPHYDRVYIASDETRRKLSENCHCSKIIFNTETGIYYDSMQEVADLLKRDRGTISKILNGFFENRTSFVLADVGYKIPFIKKDRKPKTDRHYGVQTHYKLVLNLETGVYYNGVVEASKTINFDDQTMRKWMAKNKLPLIYA